MPDPIPLQPRRDDTAADTGSLVKLGRAEPPPVPTSTAGEATEAPAGDTDSATLKTALADVGIATTAEDQAAVQALARLDTATVQTVARWMRAKKPEAPKPTK